MNFLLTFVFFSSFQAVASPSDFKPRVLSVLRQGLFQEQGPAPKLPENLQMEYQSMVLTMVGSMKSEEPSRTGSWQDVEMPSLGVAESCDGPITAHFRRSRSGNPITFVLLPGSHASFRRGGYTNQMVSLLDHKFSDPNLIALAGFQSSEFLKGRCHSILWNPTAVGADLHQRLRLLQDSLGIDGTQTGVVGFSGGATLAISAMGQDAALLQRGHAPVFGLGGLAFSPILHGRSAFELLDTRHNLSSIEKSEGLLTYTWRTATRSLWHLLVNGWGAFYPMYVKRPQEFLDRGYNEMTVGFLYKALQASGVPEDDLGDSLSYYKGYVELGFQKARAVNDSERDKEFDRATDIRPALSRVVRPLLVYLSKDDPILSTYEGTNQPKEISELLREARKNPEILVFNPSYGGHTGAVLDPVFPDLIELFFQN